MSPSVLIIPWAHQLCSGSSMIPGGTWHLLGLPCPALCLNLQLRRGCDKHPGHPCSPCIGSVPWDTPRDRALCRQDKSALMFIMAEATQPPL